MIQDYCLSPLLSHTILLMTDEPAKNKLFINYNVGKYYNTLYIQMKCKQEYISIIYEYY